MRNHDYPRPENWPDSQYHDEESRKWDSITAPASSSKFNTSLRLDQCSPIIQQWLDQCKADHRNICKSKLLHAAPSTFFPTRIIDLEDINNGSVRIRDRDEVRTVPHQHEVADSRPAERGLGFPVYWTLSHRWGDPQRLPKLVKANLVNAQRDGFHLANLPQIFQDAISVVRRLGHRYLWIDCLCIVQDSLDDWTRECASMKEVYAHSHCNIFALASASDSGIGLFRQRNFNAMFLYPRRVTLDGFVGSLWDGSEWDADVEKAPLSKRAWVVQERFLSPRVLHFAESRMYWECLESTQEEFETKSIMGQTGSDILASSSATRGSGNYTNGLSIYKAARRNLIVVRQSVSGRPRKSTELDGRQHVAQWCNIVSIYASCTLTQESDRLVAMHGIAATFDKVKGSTDKYLAGLWKSTLHVDLLWHTGGPDEQWKIPTRHRGSSTRVPTWSWASVAGGVVHLPLAHTRYSRVPDSLIRLINTHIEPEDGGDVFGRLYSASLTIEAMVYPYRLASDAESLVVYRDIAMTEVYFNVAMVDIRLDTRDLEMKFAKGDGIGGICVPVDSRYHGYGGGRNTYLLLEGNEEDGYERVGLFSRGAIGDWIQQPGPFTRLTLI